MIVVAGKNNIASDGADTKIKDIENKNLDDYVKGNKAWKRLVEDKR